MALMQVVRSGATTLSCCLFLGLTIAQVQAQQPTPAQTDAIRKSCRQDFMANCSGVQPGGKEALDCLKQNVGRLSPPCRTAVSAIMPAAPPSPPPAAVAVPKPPAPPVPPPAPATEMPAPARQPMPTEIPAPRQPTHAQTDAIRQSCRTDFAANCAGVTPGGKAALQCLKSHIARLSPACRTAVAAVERAPSGAGQPPKRAPTTAVAAPMPVEPPPGNPAPMAVPPAAASDLRIADRSGGHAAGLQT